MKILFIGDVMGGTGRRAVESVLREICEKYAPDIVLANGENSCGGRGMNRKSYEELSAQGVDAFTMGNHLCDNREVFTLMREFGNIVRPANYRGDMPGRFCVLERGGEKLAVLNLAGRVYLEDCDSPFQTAEKLLAELPSDVKNVLVDIHAEATSEKAALAWFLDGRVSAVLGTHTHVQTNDARILPRGTAFITDVGMTGARDSILGMDKDLVQQRFLTQDKVRLQVATGDMQFNAVLVETNSNGRALGISIINEIITCF